MADIVLQGVPSTAPPGVYVQLNFAQGASGAPTQIYSVLFLANFTSQGSVASSFTPGQVFGPTTLVPCQTVQDAINLFGAGSGAHLMLAAFRAKNVTTPVFVAPVQPATGVAASQVVTIVANGTGGNPAQTVGVVSYRVDGKSPAQAVFQATDTATTIATNLAAAINGNVNLPVTAASAAGVLTVTAKVVGARGNDLRGFAQVVSGSGVTVSVTSPAFFTSGAGSDAAGYTATLAALASNGQRYYYYVCEAGLDNTDGYVNGIPALVQSQIDSMALPDIGLRQRALFGSNDTVAHTAAAVTEINDPRLEVIQCKNLDLTPGELAASWAAAITAIETVPLTAQDVNFDGFGADAGSQPLWSIPAPLDGSAPSSSDIQTCVVSGITSLRVAPGNTTNVVKRATTRYFTLAGSSQVLDLRVTDSGKVTICDRFFDDLSALIALRYPRMMIGNDPVSGSPPPAPGVVTPSKIKNTCLEVIQTYAAAGLINGPATAAGLLVQRNVTPSTSIGILVPLFVADPLHTVLIMGNQLPSFIV
jgi:phage tail sheath gpL-like